MTKARILKPEQDDFYYGESKSMVVTDGPNNTLVMIPTLSVWQEKRDRIDIPSSRTRGTSTPSCVISISNRKVPTSTQAKRGEHRRAGSR